MIRPSLVRKSYLTDGEWVAITHLGNVKRFTNWKKAMEWAVNEYLLTVQTFGDWHQDIYSPGAIQ